MSGGEAEQTRLLNAGSVCKKLRKVSGLWVPLWSKMEDNKKHCTKQLRETSSRALGCASHRAASGRGTSRGLAVLSKRGSDGPQKEQHSGENCFSLQEGRSHAPAPQIPAHLGACGELTEKWVLNPTLDKNKYKLTAPGFTFTVYSSEENPERFMA